MNILAIIPARGGSKGIPRKNIKMLAGRPLIAWSIKAALDASVVDRVIVSTDDKEIAETAAKSGADVPFLRPPELATDTAKSLDVVLDLLDTLKRTEGYVPGFVLLLQPTSPLRLPVDIQAAIALAKHKEADAVVSVCEVPHPASLLREIDTEGRLLGSLESGLVTRRQDARMMCQLNGSIFFIRTSVVYKDRTFLPRNTFAYIMPAERSIDIDTDWEFHLADLVLKEKHGT